MRSKSGRRSPSSTAEKYRLTAKSSKGKRRSTNPRFPGNLYCRIKLLKTKCSAAASSTQDKLNWKRRKSGKIQHSRKLSNWSRQRRNVRAVPKNSSIVLHSTTHREL